MLTGKESLIKTSCWQILEAFSRIRYLVEIRLFAKLMKDPAEGKSVIGRVDRSNSVIPKLFSNSLIILETVFISMFSSMAVREMLKVSVILRKTCQDRRLSTGFIVLVLKK